ncbi:hypothetical protein [Streptomyces hyaluromycini]|uniref:hypothetical protein n=1 Tax=Streptomyces hyaluromycini TaxID=1377993 RepID=UPI0012382EE5|nr:hypothetical protein [Streptomyces hyaluromycini]
MISLTLVFATFAVASCAAAGMILSRRPIRAHEGIDFHAGSPDGSVTAEASGGHWVAMIWQPCADARDRACFVACPVDCAEYVQVSSGQEGETFVLNGDRRVNADLIPQGSHRTDTAAFSMRKEETADADPWLPC